MDVRPALRVLEYHPQPKNIRKVVEHQLSISPHKWLVLDTDTFSAVDNQRSRDAQQFLDATKQNVLVLKDHDVYPTYGSLDHLAEKAIEVDGVVGALVSKRGIGQGFGSRICDGREHRLFTDDLIELGEDDYLGGALMAIPRSVFERIIEAGHCPKVIEGYHPFFIPRTKFNRQLPEPGYDYLTEDWAFSHYAREAGCKVYVTMRIVNGHQGGMQMFTPMTALDGEGAHA